MPRLGVIASPGNEGRRRAAAERGPGLSSAEAASRLEWEGRNVLPTAPRPPAWRSLVAQMVHFFAVMLWVAAGCALLAGLPTLAGAIGLVVIVNGVFAFIQEHRAERASEALRGLLPFRTIVVRDGRPVEIDATELVPGDLVILSAGDRVSADLEVVEAHGLLLDTSTLTGESVASAVGPGDTAYAGTFVVEGEGRAAVNTTGAHTRLAGITLLTRAGRRPPSPLARALHRLVLTIAAIAVGVGGSFFGLSLLLGTPASDGVVLALGVTVALVPEGLLPTVTLSLALGAQGMAQRHALVRRLESVETLGSTTFICTDKTGTLTLNQMTVTEVWTPAGEIQIAGPGYGPEASVMPSSPAALAAGKTAALAAARCSSGRAVERDGTWAAQGDPMEAAIDSLARRLGLDVAQDRRLTPAGPRFPFDPRRRRMSLVAGDRLLVKGAPDAVLPVCAPVAGAARTLEDLTQRGLRVLAVASRPAPPVDSGVKPEDVEIGLTLLGLLALEDPPRPTAPAAIAACRRAGVRVAMVTGDHPATAAAIAREIGLSTPDGLVLTGTDLPDDLDALADLVDRDGIVLARVSPEDKLRVAQALHRRGHVVAMTGDGVNDGPALQEADVGVAMGMSGTDVAREAADLVLLDDDFSTIVTAIEQGRATFLNVRRFLTYHLTDNVAEVTPFLIWALSGGRVPLALGVLQILALDIGTDTLSAVALGAEPPAPHVLERPAVSGQLLDESVRRRAFARLGPIEAAMAMGAFMVSLFSAGWRPGSPFPSGAALAAASGAAFATVVIGQTANAFACRSSTRTPGHLGWTTNRLLLGAVVIELALAGMFLFAGPLAQVLEHQAPPVAGWVVALVTAPVVLAVDAWDKAARNRQSRRRRDDAGPRSHALPTGASARAAVARRSSNHEGGQP